MTDSLELPVPCNFDVAAAREKEVRHDVMAHVYAYGGQCPDAKGIDVYKRQGLTYIPLAPKLETNTRLVWKKNQTMSPAVDASIHFTKKYINRISNDKI